MAIAILSWLLAIPLLGLATGLRTFTPMAVLCWFSYMGYLSVDGTWAAWTASGTAVAVFSVLAVAEYIGDKLPRVPNRTSTGPLLLRIIFGGLVGSIAATAMNGPGVEGVMLGVGGAAVGAFAGFMIRRDLVQKIGCADWPIAVGEDIFTILCAGYCLYVVSA